MRVLLALVLACSTGYATVRYVVFGGVSPEQIPLFVLNKAVAMSAAISLLCAAVAPWTERRDAVRFWGTAAVHCAAIHILASFAILSKPYYPGLFGPERMNLIGGLSIALGIGAAYLLLVVMPATKDRARGLQVLALLLVAGHVGVMGYRGWLTVSRWHGHMPPITLISCLAVLAAAVFVLSRPSPVPGRIRGGAAG